MISSEPLPTPEAWLGHVVREMNTALDIVDEPADSIEALLTNGVTEEAAIGGVLVMLLNPVESFFDILFSLLKGTNSADLNHEVRVMQLLKSSWIIPLSTKYIFSFPFSVVADRRLRRQTATTTTTRRRGGALRCFLSF